MGIIQDLRYPVMVSDAVGKRYVTDLQFEATALSWIADPYQVAGSVCCSPLCCASNMVEEPSDAIATPLIVSCGLFALRTR